MPQRWKRRVEAVRQPLPYANNPAPGIGLPGLVSGSDAPLSLRARTIFRGLVVALIVTGVVLVVLAR